MPRSRLPTARADQQLVNERIINLSLDGVSRSTDVPASPRAQPTSQQRSHTVKISIGARVVRCLPAPAQATRSTAPPRGQAAFRTVSASIQGEASVGST